MYIEYVYYIGGIRCVCVYIYSINIYTLYVHTPVEGRVWGEGGRRHFSRAFATSCQ